MLEQLIFDEEIDSIEGVGDLTKGKAQELHSMLKGDLAIVGYGSRACGKPKPDSLYDFYVVVGNYQKFYKENEQTAKLPSFPFSRSAKIQAWLNQFGPNYYQMNEKDLRFVIVSLSEMKNAQNSTNGWLKMRLTKPTRTFIVEPGIEEELTSYLSSYREELALLTLVGMPEEFTTTEFIMAYLDVTYKADFRGMFEDPEKVKTIYEAGKERLEGLLGAYLNQLLETEIIGKDNRIFKNPEWPLSMRINRIRVLWTNRFLYFPLNASKGIATYSNVEETVKRKIKFGTGK